MASWFTRVALVIRENEARDPAYYADPNTKDEYVIVRPIDKIVVQTVNGPIQLSAGWDYIKPKNVYAAHRMMMLGYISKDEYRRYLESGKAKW